MTWLGRAEPERLGTTDPLSSTPQLLLALTVSTALTVMGLRMPSASGSYFPGPVATTRPRIGRSLAVSGSNTPPMVTSAVSSTYNHKIEGQA